MTCYLTHLECANCFARYATVKNESSYIDKSPVGLDAQPTKLAPRLFHRLPMIHWRSAVIDSIVALQADRR